MGDGQWGYVGGVALFGEGGLGVGVGVGSPVVEEPAGGGELAKGGGAVDRQCVIGDSRAEVWGV